MPNLAQTMYAEARKKNRLAEKQWDYTGFEIWFKRLYEELPAKRKMWEAIKTNTLDHVNALARVFEGKAELGFYEEHTRFKSWWKDIGELALVTVCMFVFIRTLQALVFPLLARVLRIPAHKRTKAAEAIREFTFYSLSLYLWSEGTQVLTWMKDYDLLWSDNRQDVVEREFKALYFFEASWYMAGFLSLLIDSRRKDFWEMMFHHIFTCLLLLISYHEGHLRVGAVVVFLHNLADPFLQGAKLFNYMNMEKSSTITFVVFAVIFIVSRLVIYPQVIHSCQYRGPAYFFDRDLNNLENLLIALLAALVPIHTYWIYLIFRVIAKSLSSKTGVEDARSDSEDDEPPPPEPETKKTK
mmetsp:Transcript_9945/g.11535  ORF Transcript_9945/g.11535 Transcript_9945/m.11535 type:complete len:355 (-) Transcript_9945:291-1355(-)